jgi:aspartyl-tRNA(Asn)/glutamyl-tRNA(Gln) amidotransferase subunit A
MEDYIKKYLFRIEKNDKQGENINSFLQVLPIRNSKKGLLSGKVIAVKANINVKGLNCSCASKTLENYKSAYDATVIKKIKDEGEVIIGLTNMDEFACGWSGETSAFGATKNPVNPSLVAGGSSSGSAAAVASGFCDMALGSDTGGSIRVPSSHCGVVGVKPTYGSVSRYGLIDMCMSFDQIGPITKNVSDAALLLSIIQGKDNCDAISQESKKIDIKKIEDIPKNLKVGLLDFSVSDKRIQNLIEEKIKNASMKYGWSFEKLKIPNLELAIATYFPIVYVEFFSATRRFDGRRYGKKIEDVCGPEVLRRILGGSEITKAEYRGRYYNQALKVRVLLQKEFEKVFKKIDCFVSPVVPRLPHKIGEKISVEEMFEYDALTCVTNIVGNCAMSLPVGEIDGVPVGMHISCDKWKDELMLRIGRSVERLEK